MATLQNLYNNIKTLITKYFEEKTIEDETLPQIVESYFNYNQGKLNIGMPHMELTVTGSSFSTFSSSPFAYTNRVFVDWGDDTIIEYVGGTLSHSYSVSDTYTVKIYGNITSLGNNCFRSCTGLTSITLSDTVTSLGKGCFYDCTGLTSIIIPDSVTNFGHYCFGGCFSLTSVIIPDSATSLGMDCFYWCNSLTSIIIPDSVINLEESCFSHCTGLTSINLNWNTSNKILTYDSSWIDSANNNLKFIIPNGTTSLYTAKGYPSELLQESD